MLREVYIVVWNREEAFVFTSEEKAIDKVEQITGRGNKNIIEKTITINIFFIIFLLLS